MDNRREHLGWIRLVVYQGRATVVGAARGEWIGGEGDTLRDAERPLSRGLVNAG
jgi:hypothetical protein